MSGKFRNLKLEERFKQIEEENKVKMWQGKVAMQDQCSNILQGQKEKSEVC